MTTNTTGFTRIAILAAAALLVPAGNVWGVTLSQFTLNGANSLCECSVNVKVDFTAQENGDLYVVLSNLTDSVYDRQVLTGIQFEYKGSGSSTGSVTSQTPNGDTLYNIDDKSGKLSEASGVKLTAWHTQPDVDLSPYVTLTNLGGKDAKGGAQGILGSATSGEVKSLSNYNPYVNGTATIVISGLSGVSSSTAITAVNFNFGTALDNYIAGHPDKNSDEDLIMAVATPEPGTLSMLAGAGILLALGSRRRKSGKTGKS